MIRLAPDILLQAYAAGIFPMAEPADDSELFWVDPKRRGIIPLDGLHVPRRLRRVLRRGVFSVRCDTAFEAVIRGCAEANETRPTTWINDEIVRLYTALFVGGAAHSVECWHAGELVGGLYGVSLGARVFRREHVQPGHRRQQGRAGPSRGAAAAGGYRLLDTQFVTPHLAQFGAIEIARARYHRLLAEALRYRAFSRATCLSALAVGRQRAPGAGGPARFAFEQVTS